MHQKDGRGFTKLPNRHPGCIISVPLSPPASSLRVGTGGLDRFQPPKRGDDDSQAINPSKSTPDPISSPNELGRFEQPLPQSCKLGVE
ncbi:hypothetical protein A9K55_004096 [Cordyceps militaris]|uniref:Uncharacterized protein n=1 Tax=Cordyceps militaris TaxID=73501 RepID=A0A2H4SLD3_CORMI|nr:hypothetical protein A9K55_004096 [Cordyceps militaris]